MRLALGLDDALTGIAKSATTENGRWFSVMGQPAVRAVFEVALGLPSSVGALDLDLQLNIFREQMESRFGDGEISQFSDPDKIEEIRTLFLLQSDINASQSLWNGSSTALYILQNSTNERTNY